MMRTGREERQEERGNYGGEVGGKRRCKCSGDARIKRRRSSWKKEKKYMTKGKIVEKKETTK